MAGQQWININTNQIKDFEVISSTGAIDTALRSQLYGGGWIPYSPDMKIPTPTPTPTPAPLSLGGHEHPGRLPIPGVLPRSLGGHEHPGRQPIPQVLPPPLTPSYQAAQTLLTPYIKTDPQTQTMSVDVQAAVQTLHPSDVQSALMALNVAGAPKLVQQAQTYLDDRKVLEKYRKDGEYDIVGIYESKDEKAIDAAGRMFKAKDLQVARRLALPVVPYDEWKKLSKDEQEKHRFLAPKPLREYQRLSDFEKSFYYPETKVTAAQWEKLGPAGRKYAVLAPTPTEKLADLPGTLRHTVSEGLGKGHEWLAKNTMPGIGRQLALGGYDLLGIPVQLGAVAFDVGAKLGKAEPKEAGKVITETAKSMGQWFAAIPGQVAKDPTATAYYTIMLGPMAVGAGKTASGVAKKAVTAGHPYGIPARGIAIEGSVASVKWGEAGYIPALKIMGEVQGRMITGERTRTRGMVEEAKVKVDPGNMTRRVAGVVRDAKGNILLVTDRTETPGVVSLVGGKVDPVWRKGQLGWRKNPKTGRMELDVKGAFHGQARSETGIGIRDTAFLPSYSGFTTAHSLPGTYMFLAKATKTKFDLGKGELRNAMWWNGKTKIKVYPSTYYLLRDMAKQGLIDIDMGKVKMFKGDAKAKWQAQKGHGDPAYADKLKQWEEGTYGDKYKLKGDVWRGDRIVSVPKVKRPIETELTLQYRLTPAQTEFYDVVYHATPNATSMLKELQTKGHITVKGKLFSSPQAAMRFVAKGAAGEAPVNPAVFAIRVPKNLVPKLADFPYKQWKGGIEAEVVFKGGVKLSPTPLNLLARLRGTSGAKMEQSVEGDVFMHRKIGKGRAVTGETFTTYGGDTFTTKTTRVGGKVYKLDRPVGMEKGQFIPTYWLRAPGGRASVPEISRMYAVTLKAMKETIYDLAVTTGDIAKDLARLRRPEALKRIRAEYNLGEGPVGPMTSPLRFTTRAYGDIKIIQKALEAEVARLMRYAEREKGRELPDTIQYVKALEKATTTEINKILKNPKVAKLLKEERARVDEAFKVNLAKYTAALHLGQQHADRVVSLRDEVDIRSTYRYDPETGRVELESRSGITRTGREEVTTRKGPERVLPEEKPPVEEKPPTEERPPIEEGLPIERPPTEEKPPTEEIPPRETRIPIEEPPEAHAKKHVGRPPKIRIKRVEGIPRTNPGMVSWDQGITRISITPPYRPGTRDVHYTAIKPPAKGEGSPQRTITVKRGEAPRKIFLQQGFSPITILRGKTMLFGRPEVIRQRGPGLMLPSGKIQRQRRRSVLV